jgi:hypothetical protein
MKHISDRMIFLMLAVILVGFAGSSFAQQNPWQAWKHRLPIVLTERDAATAGRLPVDVTFSMFAADIGDPAKEIRLVLKTPAGEKEVPFQLSRVTVWEGDADGVKSLPTVSGTITFFDAAQGSGPAEYALLYGNPAAQAPVYATDLRVSGESPAWVIENSKMTVRLHGRNPNNGDITKAVRPITAGGWKVQPAHNTNFDSGQIARVDLKSRPGWPLAPYSGVMHWEPGIFIPARGWLHVFEWDPPPVCEIVTGPLFVEIRRSGTFPKVPEAKASVVYRIFTGRDYVESGTRIDVLEAVGVVSIRNNDMVFDNLTFTHMAFPHEGQPVIRDLKDYPRVSVNGDVLRLDDDIPYFALLNPAEKIGVGTIKEMYANVGPDGIPPVLFDNSFYLSNNGREGLMFFFRPLVYFNIGFDRKQLIQVPKGTVYAERNLFLFFEANEGQPLKEVLALNAAAGAKPRVSVGAIQWPPSR